MSSRQEPLPGANIVVTDAQAQTVARRVTATDGRFTVADLPPGDYRVSVSLPGFQAASVVAAVARGQTAQVSVTLAPVEAAPVVSVASSEVLTAGDALAPAAALASRDLDQLAPGGAGFQNAVRQFSAVMATLNGVSIKGGRPNEAGVQLGTFTLVDPASGVAHVPLPDGAIESVSVLPNPYSVEYGRFSSGLILIDPRRAGSAWRYQISRTTPIVRNARGKFLHFYLDEFRPRFSVGGPLVRDRLFVEQSGQVRYASSDVASRPENELRITKSLSSFTRTDLTISPVHSLVATGGVFPGTTSTATLGTFTPPDAAVDLHTFAGHLAAAERALWGSETVTEVSVQWLRSNADKDPHDVAPMVFLPDTTLGNFFNRQHRETATVQAVATVATGFVTGRVHHTAKAGVDVLASSFTGTSDSRMVRILRSDGTLARRLDYAGASAQSVSGTDAAMFVQDRLRLTDRWDVEVGARFDRDGILDHRNVAPRAGTAIQLTPSGRFVLRGGVGVFYGRTPATASAFSTFSGAVDRRFGTDGQTALAPSVPFVPTTSPLEPARTRTWDVGAEWRVGDDWTLRATGIARDGRGELIVVPEVIGARGEWRLTSDGRSAYRDLELAAEFRRGSRLDVEAAYDWSSARGDLNTLTGFLEPVMAPVIGVNAYAPLSIDVPQRFFVRGRMLASAQWFLLGIADWRSGLPYSAVDEALDFVGPRNNRRFPVYARVELGLERRIAAIKGRPWLGVRVTNAFNASLPVDVQANIGSPFFGRFYNSEDRHFRLLLRFGS